MKKLRLIVLPLAAGVLSNCADPIPPPTADFFASDNNIQVGDSISFNDLSSNSPDSWYWTFEGATPGFSTESNPSGITYDTAGKYDVTLIVANSPGEDTLTKTDFITVVDSVTTIADCATDSTMTDSEGNTYRIVAIGGRCWMADNLRITAGIAEVSDQTQWQNIFQNNSGEPAWCYYGNNSGNDSTYGKLYNWHAVNTGNLCPAGWRIPTQQDWEALVTHLGGPTVAGGELKSTTGWDAPNTGATNSSRFNAMPGGFRDKNGPFLDAGFTAYFWTSTVYASHASNYIYLESSIAGVGIGAALFNENGFSCRCIKE